MQAIDRRPAAFIDRDGVINEELGYVHRSEDFHFIPGAIAGMRRLQEVGYALVVVTNQAGIAKGRYTYKDFQRVTLYMKDCLVEMGVVLTGVFHCPHHPMGTVPPWNVGCRCRKPAPGMLLDAAKLHNLDLRSSVLIGDKLSDVAAGRAAGIASTVLVRTGHPLPEGAAGYCDHIATNLTAAADWVVKKFTVSQL